MAGSCPFISKIISVYKMKQTQGQSRSKIGSYGRKWRRRPWNGWKRIRFHVKTVVKSTKNTERTPRSVKITQRASADLALKKWLRERRAETDRFFLRMEEHIRKIDFLHQYTEERITNLERGIDNLLHKASETEVEIET
uniref:Uncharacterized protein LOC111114669 isoform X1 n=2 Tax=Crassostrea virginica TaxID=6565 RepID=A0A8B8BZH1_CRAVI|nr:uncharacterized protein LOC111114669 isoform X1 [Crassostrea virginica]